MIASPDPLIPTVAQMRQLLAAGKSTALPWGDYTWEVHESLGFQRHCLAVSAPISIALNDLLVRRSLWELMDPEPNDDLTIDWLSYRARVYLPVTENFDLSVLDRNFLINLNCMMMRIAAFLRIVERPLEVPVEYLQQRRAMLHQQLESALATFPLQKVNAPWSPDLRWGWILETIGDGGIPNAVLSRMLSLISVNGYDEELVRKLASIAEQEAELTNRLMILPDLSHEDRSRLKQSHFGQELAVRLMKNSLREQCKRHEMMAISPVQGITITTPAHQGSEKREVTSLTAPASDAAPDDDVVEHLIKQAVERAIEESLPSNSNVDEEAVSSDHKTTSSTDSPNEASSPSQSSSSSSTVAPSPMPNKGPAQSAPETATMPAVPAPLTAHQIAEQLSAVVVGQPAACRVLAAVGHGILRGQRVGAALMHGPTGVGKSMLIEKFAEILGNIPIQHVASTSLVPEGIVGTCFSDILRELVPTEDRKRIPEDHEPAPAPRGLLVIDEFDKLTGENEDSMSYSRSIINALLRIVDGGIYHLEDSRRCPRISTKNILVILAGSWQCLRDQRTSSDSSMGFVTARESQSTMTSVALTLDDFSIPRELRGRITRVVPLMSLRREDLLGILDHPISSPWRLLQDVLGMQGEALQIAPGVNEYLADIGIERGYGARWLSRPILALADRLLLDGQTFQSGTLRVTLDMLLPDVQEAA